MVSRRSRSPAQHKKDHQYPDFKKLEVEQSEQKSQPTAPVLNAAEPTLMEEHLVGSMLICLVLQLIHVALVTGAYFLYPGTATFVLMILAGLCEGVILLILTFGFLVMRKHWSGASKPFLLG